MSDVDDTQPAVGTSAPAPLDRPIAVSAPVAAQPLDLDGIERDLADVELALTRLDDGTYWTDEVTGDQLHDDLLAERPTARRLTDR